MVAEAEAMLGTGYDAITTTVEPVTTRYDSPGHWWESSWTQAPRLAWQHIPPADRDAARDDAFRILEVIRAPDGTPVNAVRGLLDTIGRLVRGRQPAALVACRRGGFRGYSHGTGRAAGRRARAGPGPLVTPWEASAPTLPLGRLTASPPPTCRFVL